MLLPLFHLSVVAINYYTMWYDQQYLDFPFPAEGYARLPLKGRLMFLTMWCMLLQTAYFSISFLNDVLGTGEPFPRKPPIIRILKDTIFSLAFPVAIYVPASFWAIYFWDKELILPEFIEREMPFWLNHVLHLFVAVFILIELFVTNRTYPSRRIGLTLSTIFNVGYLVWLNVLYAQTNAWVYPFFDAINLPTRCVFFVASVSSGYLFYLFGEKLNGALSGKPVAVTNGSIRKKQ